MTRFMYLWVAVMVIITLSVACTLARQEAAEPEQDLIRVNAQRIEERELDGEQTAPLVQGNNTFAIDLYQAVTEGSNENLIFSPYSISLAFSMVYGGARGETQTQMMDVLHALSQDAHHPAFNAVDQHLNRLAEDMPEGDDVGEAFQLNIANAVWAQEDFPFREQYLQLLAEQYGSGMHPVDFGTEAAAAREAINNWIAEETQQRITDMVDSSTVNEQTRLVLANAIYFYGAWLRPFNESATKDGPFTLLDGRRVDVPLMHDVLRVQYGEGDGYQVVQLPYTGNKVDMLVFLPEAERFQEIEQQMSLDFLESVRSQLEQRDVTVTFPRFEFESELNLKEALSKMGLTNPFDSGADFSGMVEGGGLWIGAALHKGNITVDEEGTEAAAATVIVMQTSALETAEFGATRPFIFAIVERETGSILFLGRVMDPS